MSRSVEMKWVICPWQLRSGVIDFSTVKVLPFLFRFTHNSTKHLASQDGLPHIFVDGWRLFL